VHSHTASACCILSAAAPGSTLQCAVGVACFILLIYIHRYHSDCFTVLHLNRHSVTGHVAGVMSSVASDGAVSLTCLG
jgi:hypothetical protein